MDKPRDRWIKVALIGIGIFNFADYFLTLRALSLGIPEGNPYMDALIGTPWFAVVKLIVVPAGLYRIWMVRHGMQWISRGLLVFVLAAYTWVTVYHMFGLMSAIMR